MVSFKLVTCVLVIGLSALAMANPAKSNQMDNLVEEMRSSCADGQDALGCMKYKVAGFLDALFKKDSFKITDDIEVRANGFSGKSETGRSDAGLVDTVEKYLESHDITFNVPAADAKFTLSPQNINDDELNLKIKFNGEGRSAVESRKSKLKKIVIPILVFVLLKAMTLIPFGLGVLGLKAWNALQLSFFSFVISIALAIFQLCKKIAADNHHPQIATHGAWEAARSFASPAVEPVPQFDAQNLAYNAYN